jgi:carbon monoxide dehydrogenase subunit G
MQRGRERVKRAWVAQVRFEQAVTVTVSPERVWDVLADWERYPEWMPDVSWVRRLGEEEGTGMRLAVRTKVLGVPLVTDELLITAWEPPQRMAVYHKGMVRGEAQWRLEASDGGTRFTWIEDLRMPPPVLGAMALFLYSPVLRWNFGRSMRKLSERVSGSSG